MNICERSKGTVRERKGSRGKIPDMVREKSVNFIFKIELNPVTYH